MSVRKIISATAAMLAIQVMGEYTSMMYDFDLKQSLLEKTHNDVEMERAVRSNEKEQWYWCEMPNGGHTYHRYKPTVARLLTQRDGLRRVLEY